MNYFLIAYIFLATLSLGNSIGTHGNERRPENAWVTLISYIIGVGLVTLAVLNK